MAQAQLDEEVVYYYYLYYTVVLATILVVVARFLVVKLRRRNSGENPPPGPWQLPVIGSLHHLFGALPHHAMRDLARQHGPLMLLRLGELRLVVASSATAAREVMKTHDAAFAKRPRTTTINAITRNGVGIVYAPQDEQWRQVRKLCMNELLSPWQVRSLQATREAEAARLVAALASAVGAEPVNFSSHILTYVNDVVVRAVVGDRMTDRDAFLECLDEGIKVATGFTLADLFPSSRLARAFSRTSRRVEAVVSDMKRIMDGVIDEHLARRSSKEEEEDLLDVLLRIQTDGGLQVPLEAGTIRAMITVS
jgi:cytochrome P450